MLAGGESGLNGRAIDFAKFGSLFLHNGTWNSRQLISTTWATESTAPDPSDTRASISDQFWKNPGGYYMYQWWGFPLKTGGYAYAAHCHLGQMIAVFPQDQLIVVRFGISDGGVDSWDQVALEIAAKARTS